MQEYTYPIVNITENKVLLEFYTVLRKEREGIWYDIECIQKIYKDEYYAIDKLTALDKFHGLIYKTLICYDITTEDEVPWLSDFNKASDDQTDEYDRLKDDVY